MNKAFKLTLITISTFIIFLFVVGIFLNLSFTLENYTIHTIRIMLIAFFTLCVSTPILMNLKIYQTKEINKYIIMIITFFLILIISYWGVNIVRHEEHTNTLNSTSNIASYELRKKEEQQQQIAKILEDTKKGTYKEYIIKGIIEMVIMLISILGVQRILLVKG